MARAAKGPVAAWLDGERRRSAGPLRLAVGLGLAGGLLLIAQAGLLARLADAVVLHGAVLADLWPLLWGLLALFLGRAILTWAAERTAFAAAAAVKHSVRERLFAQLQRIGPARLGRERSGELANSVVDGVEALEPYYARYLPQMSLAALLPLAILAFVLPADWISAVVLVFTAPLIPLFMILIGKGAEELNQSQWRRLAQLSGRLLDSIQGLTTLKLLEASRREAAVIARLSDDYRQSTMAVLRVAFLSSLALEFLASVSIAVVAVLIGFRLLGELDWGPIDLRVGLFVLLLAPEFYQPLRNLGSHYHARMEAIGAGERLVELLAMPVPERPSAARPVPAGPRFEIAFEAVHFAYAPGRAALQGASFAIAPGERVALVGPSGAGKSTVLNLLLGFLVPDEGAIRINGEDLTAIDPEDWRAQLAWVPQQPRLFHGTLRENLLLGRPDADEAALREATRLAHADEFIKRLPAGLDTLVGERGQGLSGGQAQRIALARAFVRDAPFVLLDEATASLDADSEALVQAGIERLAAGRTLLVVAHRLSTVRRADRILVLDQGRVAEEGDHAALMARGGLYAGLVRTQLAPGSER
ncbi:cysteine export CydDC family ABC transporter permease subunit/ATP-binding protein CydD [Thioflavicoccus mobilis 8321]|uniref:Cysteine export CydDC family ABC transporter permease subunit/ATP-binding protein CydD n=1 Tax=Thioflavicoccus mobilis 8321 TaxID=765912 RepID=L0GTT8_9GAMM|nr:thiol reductant ABC exporter subunit CydD [Thioflavicoccus mobilis]AGA89227.1 cysteine export CydDC family ABC transporter permease subunit/ATP-binding protein CydD [Thioflavicoccus mobilis 8321]